MKRSPALAPLSRDHHVALEAALRLSRADAASLDDACERFRDFFDPHGRRHFEIEEEIMLPAIAGDEQLAVMGRRMRAEHERIRACADRLANREEVTTAKELGQLLHDHVRFEERELFELLEARLEPGALRELGSAIEHAERR